MESGPSYFVKLILENFYGPQSWKMPLYAVWPIGLKDVHQTDLTSDNIR